ncbi:MAG: hypothetical protein AB8B65_01410 [Kordia sp.]|uniref:hypothetical protein n=1 Tax=Kordia sp. TaxID=1965332 RepID=UPI00385BAC48
MKKTYFLLICFSFLYSCTFTGTTHKYIAPENIGTYAFQILKTLDTLQKEDFKTHFLPFKIAKPIVSSLPRKEKQLFNEFPLEKDKYASALDKSYSDLKEFSTMNAFTWKDVEFYEYAPGYFENEDVSLHLGLLKFNKNNKEYGVEIRAITTKESSGLLLLLHPTEIIQPTY